MESDLALYRELSTLIGNQTTLLLGDFNCVVDWARLPATGGGGRLVDFMQDNYLSQMVRAATRAANLLDLILTTEEEIISDVEVCEGVTGSDHRTVYCRVRVESAAGVPDLRDGLDLRKANFARFRRELSNLAISPASSAPADTLWTNFKSKYLEIQSFCIPRKHTRVQARVKPSWFHRGIAAAIRERKRLYRLQQSDQSLENLRLLHLQRRTVKRLVREAKVAEEHRVALACKANPKEFFGYVNKYKPRTPLGPIVTDDGTLVSDNLAIATKFNEYFSSVFTVEDDNLPPPVIVYDGAAPLEIISCTEAEVAAKVEAINPYRAAGPDGFLPRVLKEVAKEIAPHLREVFNSSLATGVVPLDMRSANVAPIHKKGSLSARGNYRPISLTSVPGKLLESIIKDRVVAHLDTHGLIRPSQHGFRAGMSTVTNLLEFYHNMFCTLNTTGSVDVVFLDFRKAFDKVPHRRLMSKVRALGIGGEVSRWIENWLADRRQRVLANGAPSGWTVVTSGVPQGSVLGPLLFLVYINDLDSNIVSRTSKFADDTKLGINAADLAAVEGLHADLLRIGRWSADWLMPFNTDKCHVLHVGASNPREAYSLLGAPVTPSPLERDLGVLVTEDFKFSEQCLAAERRAQKILGYIKRVFKHRTRSTVLTLYNALVRPHLEYAVQFWSPTLQTDIQRLERVQARATKLVPGIRNFGYERRLRALGMFTLEQRRLRGLLIETFKVLRGFSGMNPSSLFVPNVNPTRGHGLKVVAPRFSTSKFRDFPTVKICNVWNSLPSVVVQAPSIEAFKSRLDKILPTLRL